MDIRRKLMAGFLALLMMLSTVTAAAADETDDAADYIRQLMSYYIHYGEAAKTDMDCLIYALSEIDLNQARAWASIMEYWRYANDEMPLYPGVLPDGLPKDDSLCIVVLGFALNPDGSMRKELIGRLETALASAEKYPNAYVLCTGGGTASSNKATTEADSMAQWLTEKGIDAARIITENKSYSTVENAKYSCEILSRDYPQVTHLALVTSDYHLPRACLLFHTQMNLAACYEGKALLCVAANAAYQTGRTVRGFEQQLSDMQALTGVYVEDAPKPELSRLECILVSGRAQSVSGRELELKVVAYYDTGLYRDVSGAVKYSGFDLAGIGNQTVTITYEENGIRAVTTAELEMLPPETELPTEPPTQPPTEAPTEPPVTEPEPEEPAGFLAGNWLVLSVCIITLLAVAEVLVVLRLRKVGKLLKEAKEAEKEEPLPADDSPIEYV